MKKQSISKKDLEINKKQNLWLILGIIFSAIFLIFNLLFIFTDLFPTKNESGLYLLILAVYINFPCLITKTKSYVCLLIGTIVYFLIGSLIGILISKIKK